MTITPLSPQRSFPFPPLPPRGPAGPMGPVPLHDVLGTQIRFQLPDGSWGPWIETQGPQGVPGPSGALGGWINAMDHGAVADGSVNIATSVIPSMMAALAGTRGGVLYFPKGIYKCEGAALNYPTGAAASTEYAIRVVGDGPGATQFRSASTTLAALNVNMANNRHSFHCEGITFMAMVVNTYCGLNVTTTATAADFQRNTYQRLTFVGKNEGAEGPYFQFGQIVNNVCANSWWGCNWSGKPGDFNNGTGLRVSGDNVGSFLASIYNDLTGCHFNSLGNGIEWYSAGQGVTVFQTNFQTGCGIYCPNTGSGQNQLNVSGCCFDCKISPAIFNLKGVEILLTGNLFILGDGGPLGALSNQEAIHLGPATSSTIVGNSIDCVAGTGHIGVTFGGTGNLISANTFNGVLIGVYCDTGAGFSTVATNNYNLQSGGAKMGGPNLAAVTRGSAGGLD